MSQLPLSIGLDDLALFDTFHDGENGIAVAALRNLKSPGVWLWGAPGSGKSHLLQAAAFAESAPYYSMGDVGSPLALEGCTTGHALMLDDIDAVLGHPDWEQLLFGLYNTLTSAGGSLVVSAQLPPSNVTVNLPDLASRMAALTVFGLKTLDDTGRVTALMLRARHRGLSLSEQTIRYLVQHTDRDMRSLYRLLDRLDKASLSTGRRVTIPFVQEILASDQDD